MTADAGYGRVNLKIIKDRRLSLEAKGVYGFVAQLPDDWSFSLEKLAGYLGSSARAVSKALKELVGAGYGVAETDNIGQVVYFRLNDRGTASDIRDMVAVVPEVSDGALGRFEAVYGLPKPSEKRLISELGSRYGERAVCSALDRAKAEGVTRRRAMMYIEDCAEAVMMGRSVPTIEPRRQKHNDYDAALAFLREKFGGE